MLIYSFRKHFLITAFSPLKTDFSFDTASFPKYQSNVRETSSACFAKQIDFGYPCKFSGSFDQIFHNVLFLENLEFLPNIASSSEIRPNSFM